MKGCKGRVCGQASDICQIPLSETYSARRGLITSDVMCKLHFGLFEEVVLQTLGM